MNHTELDLIVAELMFPVLVKLAPTGNTISYKEMADLLKENNPNVAAIANITQRHIGRKLGTIWEFTKSQGCPHIGSLVVSMNGECGTGISSVVKDLPYEREKVKEFDWSTISLKFEAYLTKAKIQKEEREIKSAKKSRDEAKECFFAYLRQIKNEAPISRDEALEIKDKIIELVQNGSSPEEAFSQELIRLIGSRRQQTSEKGFVYVGRYVDAETGQPLFDQLKIGYTTNLSSRAFALSGGVAGPLEFEMLWHWEFNPEMAFAVEQAMHGRFSRYRRRGEFFNNESNLLAELVDDEITQRYGCALLGSNYE